MARLLDFKGKTLDNINGKERVVERDNNEIAIIGMSGMIGEAKNLEEFWGKLKSGMDFVQQLSEERKRNNIEYENYLKSHGVLVDGVEYLEGTYFHEINKFDHEFFSMSRREACNIDPNQRKFTQVAYHAIEDAGYGGERLSGSKTGVFLGYSDDFYDNYRNNILINDPSVFGISLVGNVRSIISSRIAYYLNLKGPSITYDTACSSSLIAIKEACTKINNGECEMAIAGGVKLIIAPIKGEDDWETKIQSSDCRARTFDDDSSGTGIGEGAIAFVLKKLDKAIEDRDNIHAVIKGWTANQDGKSIGITAPNPNAQEELTIELLKKTNTNPEEIIGVEAHGTGTKLGDPIEVMALTNAFRKFTDKKQFCSISSVKTNIGHLDGAAGAAGLAKAILCLKNDTFAPHIHFRKLNENISLINSPFFITDTLIKTENHMNRNKMIISSFGLSGTNCQLLVEKAPDILKEETILENLVLTISAKNSDTLKKYLKIHREFIENNSVNLADYVFTANTGRGHFSYRCAVVFKNKKELLDKLDEIILKGRSEEIEGVYLGHNKVVESVEKKKHDYEITLHEKETIDNEGKRLVLDDNNYELICELYIKGADINWNKFFIRYKLNRISIPVYPFDEVKCWVNKDINKLELKLVAECFENDIYSLKLKGDQWVLSEHIIDGYKVLPGTAHIEIINNIFNRYYHNYNEIKELVFMQPILLMDEKEKEIQVIFDKKEQKVVLRSKVDGVWVEHSRADIGQSDKRLEIIDLEGLITQAKDTKIIEEQGYKVGFVSTGPRWDNVREVYINDNYVLGYLELNKSLINDLANYKLHPAMFDCAVNLGKEKFNGLNYLPFKYGKLKIYNDLKEKIFTYITLKNSKSSNGEILTFDVKLLDINGEVLVDITDYAIKKTQVGVMKKKQFENKIGYYDLILENKEMNKAEKDAFLSTLVINGEGDDDESLRSIFNENIHECTFISKDKSEAEMVEIIKGKSIDQIVYSLRWTNGMTNNIDNNLEDNLYKIFKLMKEISKNKIRRKISFTVLGEVSNNSEHALTYGMGKVIEKEFDNIEFKGIDFDDATELSKIIEEIRTKSNSNLITYKNNKRYVEKFEEVKLDKANEKETILSNDGVYIISGGTGSIGLQCCKWMSEKGAKNIALLSRSGKEKEEVDKVLLEALKKESNISVYKCDISEGKHLREIICDLKKMHNKINGVVHCAGNAGDGFIINKDLKTFKNVVNPKVKGAWMLDQFLEGEELEFFIMMSSITAVSADAGQSDYTAANLFLNSFAEQKRKEGKNYISILWPAWKDGGMAVRYGVDDTKGLLKGIHNADAIQALDRVLNSDVSKVIVGELNFNVLKKIQNEVTLNFSNNIMRRLPKDINSNVVEIKNIEINILGKDLSEVDFIEKVVARVWASVLQIQDLNVNDNFSSLGGDSILAVRLLKEMNNEFDGILDISDIFAYPTVSEMADYIRKEKKGNKKEDSIEDEEEFIDDILDKLESGEVQVDDIESLLRLN